MEIPLTRGYVALVDDADYPALAAQKWHAQTTPDGYVYAAHKRDGRTILMHRHLLRVVDRRILVDHINGDTLDYRRANLRKCSHAQNSRNQKPIESRRFKGAHKVGNRWQARIGLQGCIAYLGTFKTEIEAALAYDTAAKQFFGEFGRLNFPDEQVLSPLAGQNSEGAAQCSETQITENFREVAA